MSVGGHFTPVWADAAETRRPGAGPEAKSSSSTVLSMFIDFVLLWVSTCFGGGVDGVVVVLS